MSKKRMAEFAVAAVLLAGLGGTAFAQADAIAARQAFMKSLNGKMAAIRNFAGDPTAAKAAAADIEKGFKAFHGQFPAGSDATAGKTRAKAEIWSDAAGFKAANDRSAAAAAQLVAATNSGDAAAVTTALGAVTQTCGGCHNAYRGPPVP